MGVVGMIAAMILLPIAATIVQLAVSREERVARLERMAGTYLA